MDVYFSSVQKTVDNSHDLWDKNTSPSDCLNSRLSTFAEELCLHNDWLLRKMAFSQNLEIALKSQKFVKIVQTRSWKYVD